MTSHFQLLSWTVSKKCESNNYQITLYLLYMKKTVKLTESDLLRIIKRLVRENEGPQFNSEVLEALTDYGFAKKNCKNYDARTESLSTQFCHKQNPNLIVLYDGVGLELVNTNTEEIIKTWEKFEPNNLIEFEESLKSSSLNEQDEKMENCNNFNKQMGYLSKLAVRAIAFLPNKLQNVVKKSFDSAIQSGDESKFLSSLPSNIKAEVEKKRGQLSSGIKNRRDLENKLDIIASSEVNEQLEFVTPVIRIVQTIVFLLVILKFAGLLKKRNPSCSYAFF